MNMSTANWPEGPLTALVTPLKDHDVLDIRALHLLLERQIEAGVSGVVIGGGTGEFGALSCDERHQLAHETAQFLDTRLPFIVQTGALATRDVLALSLDAQKLGATGILVASPFGEPINWRERMNFYQQVDALGVPIMIYNTPPAGLLSLTQIHQLASLPNVNAIKDSSGDITSLGDLLAWSVGFDFRVYVGFDSLLAFAAASGAHGTVLGTGNLVPSEIAEIFRLYRQGRTDGDSEALWQEMRRFLRFMEESPNYVGLCKHGLKIEGLDVGDVRAPYLMPLADEQDALAERLQAVKQVFAHTRPAVR
jgi:dihydrodipicolinate synthase/N-acetylneuraminate lyase